MLIKAWLIDIRDCVKLEVLNMSAFLCEDITINRIVSFLLDDAWGKDEFNAPLREIGINLRSDTLGTAMEGSCRQLASALRMLNLYALKCRYGDRIDECTDPPEFDFHLINPVITPEEFTYTLSCLLYQCSEGDAIEKPLYKVIDQIDDLARAHYDDSGVSNAEFWRWEFWR